MQCIELCHPNFFDNLTLANFHGELDIVFAVNLVDQGGVHVVAVKSKLPQKGRLADALARYNGSYGQYWYAERVLDAWARRWR